MHSAYCGSRLRGAAVYRSKNPREQNKQVFVTYKFFGYKGMTMTSGYKGTKFNFLLYKDQLMKQMSQMNSSMLINISFVMTRTMILTLQLSPMKLLRSENVSMNHSTVMMIHH